MPADARVAAIVLAAGEGKRLKSKLPKVLHRAAGRSLLVHVLSALETLALDRTVVIASDRVNEIEGLVSASGAGDGIDYALQSPPLGTGDATAIGLEALAGFEGEVLVLPGDTPGLSGKTLGRLLELHRDTGAAASILTASVDDPSGYGRIVRGPDDTVTAIVEQRDASEEELAISEINTSVYVFTADRLRAALPLVGKDNSQGEYYLTDVIGLLRKEGAVVAALETSSEEVAGVNDRAQLAEATAHLRRAACERWMAAGVTIVDPATTYIDSTVTIEPDVTILPGTFLEGQTVVRSDATVGPYSRVIDSEVDSGAIVTYSVVVSSQIGPEATVGPFASLRAGTVLGAGGRLGTFVETKKARLGRESKAAHLAYLGDVEIGEGVNVGAGTITTNWDGREKHATVIEDDAYIGSDTMLVAPVRIGKRAATGAGAVVREDVPDDALAVGVPARNIEGKGDRMGARGKSEGSQDADD